MNSFPAETDDEVRAIAQNLTPAMVRTVLGATRSYGMWVFDADFQGTLLALHRRGLAVPVGWPHVSSFGMFTSQARLTDLGIRVRAQLSELDKPS